MSSPESSPSRGPEAKEQKELNIQEVKGLFDGYRILAEQLEEEREYLGVPEDLDKKIGEIITHVNEDVEQYPEVFNTRGDTPHDNIHSEKPSFREAYGQLDSEARQQLLENVVGLEKAVYHEPHLRELLIEEASPDADEKHLQWLDQVVAQGNSPDLPNRGYSTTR